MDSYINLMKSTKKLVSFIIRTGNWKARININIDTRITGRDYIEATTEAIESCFGEVERDNCEMLQLFNEEGKDFFSSTYNGDPLEIPEFLFGIIIVCYLEKDEHNRKKWKMSTLSKIFANASQSDNYNIAINLEKKWKTHINKLLDRQQKLTKVIKKKKSSLKKVDHKPKL